MEIRSPVRICNISVIPSRNPRFHRKEIDLGEGRSIRDLFIIFIKGWVFISCFFIRMRILLIGLGYTLGLKGLIL